MMKEPPCVSAPVSAIPLPSLLFSKGSQTHHKDPYALTRLQPHEKKNWPSSEDRQSQPVAKASTSRLGHCQGYNQLSGSCTGKPRAELTGWNSSCSRKMDVPFWTMPQPGPRSRTDHDTESSSPQVTSEQTAAFYTGNRFLGCWLGFLSYKTSSKTEIMKNRSILKTPPAVLEREREKKKQKFNNAAAGRKGALP